MKTKKSYIEQITADKKRQQLTMLEKRQNAIKQVMKTTPIGDPCWLVIGAMLENVENQIKDLS